MRVNESCANCLYGKQEAISKDPGFLAEIREIIDGRRDTDTAPYLVYLFGKAYEKHIGQRSPFAEKKKAFNDLVLQAEKEIRRKIASSGDPVRTALLFSRIGNYIDFGALKEVDENAFLAMLDDAAAGAAQTDVGRSSAAQLTEEGIRSFKEACAEGRHFPVSRADERQFYMPVLLRSAVTVGFSPGSSPQPGCKLQRIIPFFR